MYKKLTAKIPNSVVVACSGGSDSLASLVFAHNHGKRNVTALYVNHNTGAFADKSEIFVRMFCEIRNIPVQTEYVSGRTEAEWSRARNEIYNSLPVPVIVAHNLDDAAEWWMMRAIRGKQPELMLPKNKNVIRPFLLWEKTEMREFLLNNGVSEWMEDPTNTDGNSNMRSKMRDRLMPVVTDLGDLKSVLFNRYMEMNDAIDC